MTFVFQVPYLTCTDTFSVSLLLISLRSDLTPLVDVVRISSKWVVYLVTIWKCALSTHFVWGQAPVGVRSATFLAPSFKLLRHIQTSINILFCDSFHHACALGGVDTFWWAPYLVFKLSFRSYLLVLGLLTAMFGVAGTLFSTSQRAQNQGKVCGSLVRSLISTWTMCFRVVAS